MPETTHTDSNHSKPREPFKQNSEFGLRLIVAVGAVLIIALLFVSIFMPNLTERVKFFTANTLSVLVLAVIVVQAYIYGRQWEAMQQQLAVMKDTLAETRRIFDLTERPIIIAKAATIPEIEPIPDTAPQKPLSPIVWFANKGRTMAQEFNITVEIAAKKGYMYVFGFEDTGACPSGGFLLAAGDEINIQGAPADAVTLDEEFFKSAMGGHESFMIHGKGTYKDLADREYRINYAFLFHPGHGFMPYPYPKPWSDQPEETDQN